MLVVSGRDLLLLLPSAPECRWCCQLPGGEDALVSETVFPEAVNLVEAHRLTMHNHPLVIAVCCYGFGAICCELHGNEPLAINLSWADGVTLG
jgi:hypothetical protein